MAQLDQHGDSLLTAKQAASMLNVTEGTIRRWIRRGELRAVRTGPYPNSPLRVATTSLVERMEQAGPERKEAS